MGTSPPCWPPCSPWCTCVNGTCVSRPIAINAVRLRTPDGRYLKAVSSQGGILVAAAVATPGASETFLFKSPTSWPLTSGDPISLEACDSSWALSGLQMRVDHTTRVIPGRKGQATLVTYEIGGAGASVFVSRPWSAGYPAYGANDPAEWTFDILKQGGGPIVDGDSVSLRINSNWGSTFFFRVTGSGGQDQARVDGDGMTQGGPGTIFVVAFNEVLTGAGWRPPSTVPCQACAGITGNVNDAKTGAPLPGAVVQALDVLENHPFSGTSGPDARFRLEDPVGRRCVPAGPIRVRATHERHQTKTIGPFTVPGSGSIVIAIALDCTEVRGVLVDVVGRPIGGVPVALLEAQHHPILDASGQPFMVVTGPDGSFVFECAPQGTVVIWTPNDPSSFHLIVVPPEGVNVMIVVQLMCGNLVGSVTNVDTMAPIPGAVVSIMGTTDTDTTDAGGQFLVSCVRPAGQKWVMAVAPGFLVGAGFGVVPTTGNSTPLNIQLKPLKVTQIALRLDWGTMPADLDLHLTGPDGQGGRFHCFWNVPAPVPTVRLDVDDVTATGPETITITPTLLSFIAGDYRCWVHDYSQATFNMSDAVVTVFTMGAAGMNQVGRFEVLNATGVQSEEVWHVVNLTVDAAGNVTLQPVQALQAGNSATVL